MYSSRQYDMVRSSGELRGTIRTAGATSWLAAAADSHGSWPSALARTSVHRFRVQFVMATPIRVRALSNFVVYAYKYSKGLTIHIF